MCLCLVVSIQFFFLFSQYSGHDSHMNRFGLWIVTRFEATTCRLLCLSVSLCHSITICVWATKPTNSFALDQASVRDININIMICLLLLFVCFCWQLICNMCVCFVAIWLAIKWIKICLHLRNNFTFVMQLQSEGFFSIFSDFNCESIGLRLGSFAANRGLPIYLRLRHGLKSKPGRNLSHFSAPSWGDLSGKEPV